MTREKAIKIVKEFINGTCLHLVDQEALETLIPELRESEDERIRKEIIEFVDTTTLSADERHHRWIAYLEKQKGQGSLFQSGIGVYYWDGKSIHFIGVPPLVHNDDKKSKHQYKTRPRYYCEEELLGNNKEQKPAVTHGEIYHVDTLGTQQVIAGKMPQKPAEPSGKLSRQDYLYQLLIDQLITYSDYEYLTGKKPVEWSEYDRGVLEDAIAATDLLGNNEKYKKENPNMAKAFRIAKDWLKHLPERFNLQPKQEWSEEDEEIAYTILNLLCSQVTYVTGQGTTSGKQYPTYPKERDWFEKRFKSLRPQLSDEDIKKIRSEEYTKGFNDAAFGGKAWRPSEEQIKALKNSAYGMYHNGDGPILRELYEQLKKLM